LGTCGGTTPREIYVFVNANGIVVVGGGGGTVVGGTVVGSEVVVVVVKGLGPVMVTLAGPAGSFVSQAATIVTTNRATKSSFRIISGPGATRNLRAIVRN
jgi:hypothetical protein